MDTLNQEATQSLRGLLTGLLPDVSPASTVALESVSISPIGLGGFLGMHDGPRAEVFGRRVNASARITVNGTNASEVNDRIDDVTDTMLSIGRDTPATEGIYRLSLQKLGDANSTGTGREAFFDVLYEYFRLPTAAGGVIESIPLGLDLDDGGGRAEFLLGETFSSESLLLFDAIDDPQSTTGAPGDWQFSATDSRIEQLSAIRGGSFQPVPRKAGTYLVLQETSDHPAVADVFMRCNLESGDRDGIGCVFRWQDVENFYFFVMSLRRNYRMLGRKVAGVFRALEEPGLNDTAGFERNRLYTLKLTALGSRFRVYLDDNLAVEGSDAAIATPGRVGFLCHGNQAAFFYDLTLARFRGTPSDQAT